MQYEIEDYSFGRIIINGKVYTQDLIIYPDSIEDSWWRKKGHSLVPEDIPRVLEMKPDVLVMGTGASGVLKVPASTKKQLADEGIELLDAPTDRAVQEYNRLKSGKRVVGAFHLTC
jgi:hypothetical protein